MTLGEYMDRFDLIDREIAEEIGVSQATVNRIRNGVQTPLFETMIRIFDATEGVVTPNDFLPPNRRRKLMQVAASA